MRIGSVVLVCGGCAVAVACGGSSEVQFGAPQHTAGQAGEVGSGGAGSNGKGGSSGKGGSGSNGKGGSGQSGKGGAGGDGGEAANPGGAAGDTSETGGAPGIPGTGGGGGDTGAVGGTSGSSGDAGSPPVAGNGGTVGDGGTAGDDGMAGETGLGGFAGDAGAPGSGGESGEGPEEPTLGRLRVLVSRPGGGTAVEVNVSGPGFTNKIDRSTTFSDLLPGEYNVSATSSRVPGPIVSSIYDAVVNGTPATVAAGALTNASVVYPLRRGGTGRVWATDLANGQVSAFDASRLNASSTTPGDLRLSITNGANRVLSAIAFDREGNAWIGDCSQGDIMKVPPAQLGGSGAVVVTPPIVIGPPAQAWAKCIVSLDFDSEGSLYATYHSNGIVKWTPDQLQTSATPNSTPAAYFRATSGFSGLQDSAFDLDGNLWVSSYTSGKVHKLLPSQLQTTTTTLVPAVTWSLPQAEGLAFGPDGNLWIATYDNHLGAYDPTASSLPTPARNIMFPDGFGPFAIAFDESGNLWATSFNFGSIARFNAADLTTDGAKTPSLEFTNTGIVSGAGLVFNPGID